MALLYSPSHSVNTQTRYARGVPRVDGVAHDVCQPTAAFLSSLCQQCFIPQQTLKQPCLHCLHGYQPRFQQTLCTRKPFLPAIQRAAFWSRWLGFRIVQYFLYDLGLVVLVRENRIRQLPVYLPAFLTTQPPDSHPVFCSVLGSIMTQYRAVHFHDAHLTGRAQPSRVRIRFLRATCRVLKSICSALCEIYAFGS